MKIGTLSYATEQGLGLLAKAFYYNEVLTNIIIVRNGRRHTHEEWYPDNTLQISKPSDFTSDFVKEFIAEMDVMLFFETPFEWSLIPFCRDVGTKSALMPMHECMPETWHYQPDIILNPSHLEQKLYAQGIHIPVPVDVRWRQRKLARHYVHNAGHLGLRGRNGTTELLQALTLVRSPIQFTLRSQEKVNIPRIPKHIDFSYIHGNVAYESLFNAGDVFIFPEKFNGLSLPLQEARASGMCVMATQRFPMTEWLPHKYLTLPRSYRPMQVGPPFRRFDCAVVDPADIAETIDKWYNTDISETSLEGKEWAEQHSWEVLRPKYMEALA